MAHETGGRSEKLRAGAARAEGETRPGKGTAPARGAQATGEARAARGGRPPRPAMPAGALRFQLFAVLGLALYWQFIRGAFIKTFFSVGGSTAATHLYFDVTLIVLAMTVAAFPGLGDTLLERRRGATAGLAVLSSCALAADVLLGVTGPSAIAAAVLSAFPFALLALGWGRSCARRMRAPGYEALPTMLALSFFLSFVVALPFVIGGADTWLFVIAPSLSGLAWLAADRADPASAAPAAVPDGGAAADRLREAQRRERSRRLLASLCAISLFAVVSGILVGADGDFGSGAFLNPTAGRQRFYETMVFALVLVALTHVTVRFPQLRAITWGLALMLVLVGVLLTLAFRDPADSTGANVLTVGRRSVWFLLWLLAVTASPQTEEELTRNIAVFFAAAFGVSYVVIDLMRLTWTGAPESPEAYIALTFVATVLIVCAFAILGTSLYDSFTQAGYEKALAELAGDGAGDGSSESAGLGALTGGRLAGGGADVTQRAALRPEGASRHRACLALAEERGLTDREQVTLEYLAMGYTMPHIAETVGVSQNTVRSHAKAIYRKLDCHSKQELIGMVEERTG